MLITSRIKATIKKFVSLNDWTDWFPVVSLIILSPFFLFPSLKHTWIFLIIPLAWILRGIKRKKILDRTVIDWPIFLLFFQVFISCLIVPDLSFSLPKIAGALFAIALFYAVIAVLKTESLIKVGITLYLCGGLLFSIIGLLGMFTFKDRYLDLIVRIKEALPHIDFNLPGAEAGFQPNAVGGTLVLFMPLYFVFSSLRRRDKTSLIYENSYFFILILSGLLITFSVLILSQSLEGWISLYLSSNIFMFVLLKNKKIKIASAFFFIAILLFLISFIYIALIDGEEITFSAVEYIKKAAAYRTQTWTVGIEAVKHHPFTGVGMNRLRLNPRIGYEFSHAHNHLLHTAAEMGFPALIALLVILIGAGFMSAQIWKKTSVGWMKMAVLGLGWGQVAHFLFGITDSIPLGAKTGVFFWLSLALISAIYNFVLRGKSKNSKEVINCI
jgi:putative inorganic carbon (HCO3(-)) transporter